MSFELSEFEAIIKAYQSRKQLELKRLLEESDPESIAAAEKYLGISFSLTPSPTHPIRPTRITTGQGKMKPYSGRHTLK